MFKLGGGVDCMTMYDHWSSTKVTISSKNVNAWWNYHCDGVKNVTHTFYTVFRKKVVYLIFGDNCCKCRQIFKFFHCQDSKEPPYDLGTYLQRFSSRISARRGGKLSHIHTKMANEMEVGNMKSQSKFRKSEMNKMTEKQISNPSHTSNKLHSRCRICKYCLQYLYVYIYRHNQMISDDSMTPVHNSLSCMSYLIISNL